MVHVGDNFNKGKGFIREYLSAFRYFITRLSKSHKALYRGM
ncbi:hypothetical protein KEN51_CDS0055 [Pseudomonas phage vB_Pae10145-KEN51]|uniref:Uncharacterized protein n=1 Tax=Pseudomonas phage PA7 TaxID=347330 RepID=I7CN95_9CAUD|nr:hypothetical protein FDI90_gp050 [Pseudomonas phage PA7]WNV50358.1 hypothetical protein [Pseudomonas phage PhiPizzaParty]WPJ69478.1 hypothetical protein PAZH1_355 [Pseudomonas phage PA_ZH1]WRQ05913.1 hypothetical protein IPCDMZAV_CDS0391 [Pseudomonas phage 6B]WRQ06000.1 hypothetical protein QAMIJHJT_CDS0069 [Pseudomonas phage 9-Ps-8B]WRQ06408.1 hypothetical protein FOPPYZMZ_CDS0068 [Pseudomonas phage 9Ps-7B]WRQ06759.1 hypothetical protein ZBUARNPM_CDS0010 [Pseudomonas phage 14Ps5-6]